MLKTVDHDTDSQDQAPAADAPRHQHRRRHRPWYKRLWRRAAPAFALTPNSLFVGLVMFILAVVLGILVAALQSGLALIP